MPEGRYIKEKDEEIIFNFYTTQGDLMDMASITANKDTRNTATLNGVSFSDRFKDLFQEGGWTNNLQNNMLLTAIYACANENVYFDGMLQRLVDKISDIRPVDRMAQNNMLKLFMDDINIYAPYSDKIASLAKYVDFLINANNQVLKEDGYIVDEEDYQKKIDKHNKDLEVGAKYREARDILIKNGWDFKAHPEDEEFLRAVFDMARGNSEIENEVHSVFIDYAIGHKIYNAVDRDNAYKYFLDYINEKHLDTHGLMVDTVNFANGIREGSKGLVEETARMTAQTTDLFTIITEINNTVNKRGFIESQKGFSEGDDKFYNSFFINETDFKNSGNIFDAVFGKLISQQKKLSDKAASMSELELIADTFKIVKGNNEPMDLVKEVKERLIKADMYMDPDEELILDEERQSRIDANQKNMVALAKAYILHEVQNKDTKLFFEPYLADNKYTSNDPVACYLDINHPNRIKLSDLDANKVQHDTAILEGYLEDAGMLYGDQYHRYVMGAFNSKQQVRIRDRGQRIGAFTLEEFTEDLKDNGWDFEHYPTDENYAIMIFNAYDRLSRGYGALENCGEKLLSTKINGMYQRNEVLRAMYNELKDFRDDKTIDAICDYIQADLNETRVLEATDRVKKVQPVAFYNNNVYIADVNYMDLSDIMTRNGWSQYEVRVGELINRIYNACDVSYQNGNLSEELFNALQFGVNALKSLPANISADEISRFYSDFRKKIEPFKGIEGVDSLDEYLMLLDLEAVQIDRADKEQKNAVDEPENFFTVSGGIFDNDIPSAVIDKEIENNVKDIVNDKGVVEGINSNGYLYSVSNLNIKNTTAGNDNVIAVDQGVENNFMNDSDFDADTFEFEDRDGNRFADDVNDDINGYPEQERFLREYNDFKHMRKEFLGELEEIKLSLLSTAKQRNKGLGEEGSGTTLYKNMAKSLQEAMDVLSDFSSSADKVKEALSTFKDNSAKYFKERKSIFGKRGDGNIRFLASEKGARIADRFITMYDKQLSNLKDSGKDVRIGVDVHNVSEKSITLECGKLLGVNSEKRIGRQGPAELTDKYNALKEQAELVAEINKACKTKKTDPATEYIRKSMVERALKSNLGNVEKLKIRQELTGSTIKNKIKELKNNKVFSTWAKKNTNDLFKSWNNLIKAAKTVSDKSSDAINAMTGEFGTIGDYVNQNEKAVGKSAENYERLAKAVVNQFIAKDSKYAQALVSDAFLNNKNVYDMRDDYIKQVANYFQKEKILEKKGITVEKLNRSIESGALIKSAIKNVKPKAIKEPKTKENTKAKTQNVAGK